MYICRIELKKLSQQLKCSQVIILDKKDKAVMGADHEENTEKQQKDCGNKPALEMIGKIPSFHGEKKLTTPAPQTTLFSVSTGRV